MTKTEKIITALLAGGSVEVSSKSRKYRQFTRPNKSGHFYFVGKAGALRTGMVSSASVSMEHVLPRLLLRDVGEQL